MVCMSMGLCMINIVSIAVSRTAFQKNRSQRDDVNCQLCDFICASFPISQVIHLENADIPCISLENRMKIVQHRDVERFESYMSSALYSEVQNASSIPVMVPPDFVTTSYRSICYEDD